MKAIEVIDGADNCLYSIYLATDDEFDIIFPNDTDIQFIEDIITRVDSVQLTLVLKNLWSKPISKKEVVGIYGTIFYEQYYKSSYFPARKESEMAVSF